MKLYFGLLFGFLIFFPQNIEAKSPPPGTEADVPANILIMLDNSGSMGWTRSRVLAYPLDVAVDSQGNIYAVEYNYHRVKKFNSAGKLLAQWGRYGNRSGQFRYPCGIAIDSSDNVYVVDRYNHRVQKFTSSGRYLHRWGHRGRGNRQFQYPTGISIDSNGYIYVADTNNHRIQKFTLAGRYVTKWGGRGWSANSLYYPWGVDNDGSGNVYIADTYNHRIQKYTSSGSFVTKWGRYGSGDSRFRYPWSVAVDSGGTVYVSDRYNHRIKKFTSSGTFLAKWGGFGGSGNTRFNYPIGVDFDGGNVYVADFHNHRIQTFDSGGTYISSIGGRSSGMADAKKVIKKIVSDTDLTSGANFGLMEWNSWARMRVNVSASGAGKIYTDVDRIRTGGGTALGRAMRKAQQYMLGSNSPRNKKASCQQNILIVISDGVWWGHGTAQRVARNFNRSHGIKTFVIGFNFSGSTRNYNRIAQAGGTWPDSPVMANNWQKLYETLSNYIRSIISSRLTFAAPAVMPNVQSGDHIFQSTFEFKKDTQWKGHLTKYKLNENVSVGAKIWDAGEKLNKKSASSRKIWTVGTSLPSGLNNFTISNKKDLHLLLYEGSGTNPTDADVQKLINFVRGLDSYDEDKDGSTTDARWKLGDIYHAEVAIVGPPASLENDEDENSEAYYRYNNNYQGFKTGKASQRREIIYAGANDGMLHAFDSISGEELWAFIPPSLVSKLRNMVAIKAHTSHSIYGVDSSPVVKDIYYGGTWKTVLIGGLGAGGHSYFALDVTDPNNPAHLFTFLNKPTGKIIHIWDSNGLRTEYNYDVGNTVPFEVDFSKLGESWSRPTIFYYLHKANRKWVATFGGGFNGGVNPNYGATAFTIDMEDGGKILRLSNTLDDKPGSPTFGSDIVSSVPAQMTAINADGTIKANYKGAMYYFTDLEGKLWKLDSTDKKSNVNFTEIFDSESSVANGRYAYHQVNASIGTDSNLWLYYGTGNQKKLQTISPKIKNRLYGIKDTKFPNFTATCERCKTSSITWLEDATSGSAQCPVPHKGWYINMDTNEKTTGKAEVHNKTVFFSRYKPNKSNICVPGTAKLTEHDFMCGNVLNGIDLGIGIPTAPVIYKDTIIVGIGGVPPGTKPTIPPGGSRVGNIVTIPTTRSSAGSDVKKESWKQNF